MENLGYAAILGQVVQQFVPVWIALVVTFLVSISFKRKLGLYGKLFDSPVTSRNGLGIGLYQANQLANACGVKLGLVRNEPGKVRFEARFKAD